MTEFRKNKKDQDFRNNFFTVIGIALVVISFCI